MRIILITLVLFMLCACEGGDKSIEMTCEGSTVSQSCNYGGVHYASE